MANIVQTILLGFSILLIAAGGFGMYVFFGWLGTGLFLLLTFLIIGLFAYLNDGGATAGGQPRRRRTSSKGARQRGGRRE